MNIRIVTASAGTGKTTHLCRLLQEAVATQTARPEAIVATTFTKPAAAELLNRARSALLREGQGRAAEALMTARIGTVNSVCGSLVTDFALELGLSPELRVLDENAANLELIRALASVVDADASDELDSFKEKFDQQFDWHIEVKRIIESARANGIDAPALAACAVRSRQTLDDCLGLVVGTAVQLDDDLLAAIGAAVAGIKGSVDTTKGTASYVDFLEDCRRSLQRGKLRWGNWAKLVKELPTKKSLGHAAGVQAAAAKHLGHPRLRSEMHALIDGLFQAAAAGMAAYQEHKQRLGLIDYVDQEVLALEALRNDEIRAALAGKIDLVLIDEFQDTSPLQLTIFLELARLAKQSVWVGDPKQAIYGFRGTDPALMDAAIESLTNPRDPDLVTAVVERVAGTHPVETLSTSYRSRPPLVAVTNEIFSRAFCSQGMPEERTRVEGALAADPAGLVPAIAHWPLEGKYQRDFAGAVASGVGVLVKSVPKIRDRHTGATRDATLADIAILCRTNQQCADVAEALGQQGLAAVVARVGLLDTAEAQVFTAGLRLWADPRDRLAAAQLHRILAHPEAAERFTADALADFSGDVDVASSALFQGTAAAVIQARARCPDVDLLGAFDAVLAATDLRRLCAEWGASAQRSANLDALRSHAQAYCDERQAGRDTASLVGFLRYLEEMDPGDWAWGTSRSDRCALLAGTDAITVSTWHAAKGLEWPVVVLFGLEKLREPLAYGVHVMSDRQNFDLADPLAGRWIRFWPNPYTTFNQQGLVKTAYESSPVFDDVARTSQREALRVLYVGWTRARDSIILAAQKGKLLGGILGVLRDIDPSLISEPPVSNAGDAAGVGKMVDVAWAGRPTEIEVRPCVGKPAVMTVPVPGEIRVGRAATVFARARTTPSSAEPRPFKVAETVELGPPVLWRGRADANVLGTTVHAFFAADAASMASGDRAALAAALLQRHRVQAALSAEDLVSMADRLWAWINAHFPGGRIKREWPLSQRLAGGTVMSGTADMIVESDVHLAVIDHKSAANQEGLIAKADAYYAQLMTYAEASIGAGWGKPVSTWVHLPFAGKVIAIAAAGEVP